MPPLTPSLVALSKSFAFSVFLMRKKKLIPNGKIRSAARRLWLWSWQHKEAKAKAKAGRGLWLCSVCRKLYKKVEVDHLIPCGFSSNWDEYFTKLFCSVEQLRVVCKKCHTKITEDFINGNT